MESLKSKYGGEQEQEEIKKWQKRWSLNVQTKVLSIADWQQAKVVFVGTLNLQYS
jgi:superfamily I DNA and/or RNA helicase